MWVINQWLYPGPRGGHRGIPGGKGEGEAPFYVLLRGGGCVGESRDAFATLSLGAATRDITSGGARSASRLCWSLLCSCSGARGTAGFIIISLVAALGAGWGGGILAASGTAYSLPPPAAEAGRGLHFNELAMKMKHTFLGYQCHGQGMSIHSV